MKPDESPFYITRVECPVCKTVNDFETIKMGAYSESGRDSDFCPTGRQWRNPKYQAANPLLYLMVTCSSCFYTREFNRKFREWKDDNAFRTYRQKVVRQRHLNALAEGDSLLKRLGEALWPASYPGPTAINKLLLGVLDELMLDQASHFDIGRWYLRIGWLFREQGSGQTANPSPRAVKQMRLGNALRELVGDVSRLGTKIGDIKQMVDSHPEAAASAPDDTDGPDRCHRTIHGMIENAEAITGGIESLLERLKIGGEPDCNIRGASAEAYGSHPSYAGFLGELRERWQMIPTCEWDALSLSVEHYKKAFEEARDIPPGNTQIQLTYMIGELARRVGQYQEAQQFFNLAIRSGREWIHTMNSDQTKTAMARHVVDLAVEQMHTIRETLAAAG
jgi:tetratricopeptide (TPR) repeat protein